MHGFEAPSRAAAWSGGLQALLAAVALWIAWGAYQDLRRAYDAHAHWQRVPATVASIALEPEIEFEVPEAALADLGPVRQPEMLNADEPGHTRIVLRVAQPNDLWPGDRVDLAVGPGEPPPVAILDPLIQYTPPVAALLGLVLLGWGIRSLRRSRWGTDRVWVDGRWVDSSEQALRPGLMAATGPAVEETVELRRRARRWTVAFATVLGGTVAATPLWFADNPIVAGAVAIVSLRLLLGVLAAAAEAETRRLRWDSSGLVETTCLQTRRIPWSAVGGFEHLNVNREAQEQYGRRRRRGSRPLTVYVWRISDTAGRTILDLPEAMSPPEAFDALRERLQAPRLSAAGAEIARDPVDPDAIAASARAAGAAAASADHRPGRRGLWFGVALMVLPFALATGWATLRTLWFQHGAAVAEGTVVELIADDPPSVVVAYTPPGGSPLRIESDGAEAYRGIELGQRITVFHDPEHPEDAVLDLFLDLWLVPMMLGGLLLVALAAAALLSRALRR
jgi:hypothetical protein